jgi:hypothetical protein
LPALGAIGAVGFALLPLIVAQGGHGTQWIGRWALADSLQAIPQYYLLGPSGEPLGHSIELLVALPLLAAACLGLWRIADQPSALRAARRAGAGERAGTERAAEPPAGDGGGIADAIPGSRTPERAAAMTALVAGCGVLIPTLLIAFGADYLAPRNLVGAMVPLTALIVVLALAPQTGSAGAVLLALGTLGFAVISIDVALSPRLQRGDWRGLARTLRVPATPGGRRAITTVELGTAPLEYYMPGLHNLRRGSAVRISEIDATGYAPLRPSAAVPPAPGFRLFSHSHVNGLFVYRFLAPVPRRVSQFTLRRHVIAYARPEVLVPVGTITLP